MITPAELDGMGIDINDINADSRETDEFLKNIMEAAELAGFSAEEGNIKIEPSADGITVTVTGNVPHKIRGVRAVRKNEDVLFEFSGAEELFGFLTNVNAENIEDMRLYKYGERYYVAVKRGNIPAVIYEYSVSSCKMSTAENFAAEYGEKIAEAPEILNIIRELKKID